MVQKRIKVSVKSVAATIDNGMRYAVLHRPDGFPKCRKITAYKGLRLVKIGNNMPAVRKSDLHRVFHLRMYHAYTMMPKKPRVSHRRYDGLSMGNPFKNGKIWPASITNGVLFHAKNASRTLQVTMIAATRAMKRNAVTLARLRRLPESFVAGKRLRRYLMQAILVSMMKISTASWR